MSPSCHQESAGGPLMQALQAPALLMRDLLDVLMPNIKGDEEAQLDWLGYSMMGVGVIAFLILMFMSEAKYGRYAIGISRLWGYPMNAKVAWVLQECPNLVLGLSNLALARRECIKSTPNQVLMSLFMVHYLNRTLAYPLMMRGSKPTPVSVFLLALLFCTFNGHLQMRSLAYVRAYDESWFVDPRFAVGVVVFFTGMFINTESDSMLRDLRKPGESGYKIPRGGVFNLVSGANFFGEIVEWLGFAIAQWSGAAFALFTFLNLGPRGWHHHQWYKAKFDDYPKSRRAVIPYLW